MRTARNESVSKNQPKYEDHEVSSDSSSNSNLSRRCNSYSSDNNNNTNTNTSHTGVSAHKDSEHHEQATGSSRIRGRGVRKRVMANRRERERTRSLNQALEILRNRLPVPEAEKRSKIQALRMAKAYIEFLANLERNSTTTTIDDKLDQLQLQSKELKFAPVSNSQVSQQQQHQQQQAIAASISSSVPSGELTSAAYKAPDQPASSSDQPTEFDYKFYTFRLKKQI